MPYMKMLIIFSQMNIEVPLFSVRKLIMKLRLSYSYQTQSLFSRKMLDLETLERL